MFKLCTMSRSNQTLCNSSWPSLIFIKEEYEEDSTEYSGDEEEALVMEEDKVKNQYSVILVEYSDITRGSVLMHSVHTSQQASIILKFSLC